MYPFIWVYISTHVDNGTAKFPISAEIGVRFQRLMLQNLELAWCNDTYFDIFMVTSPKCVAGDLLPFKICELHFIGLM